MKGAVPRIDRNLDVGWHDLSPAQKKYRIRYLWARARIIYNAVRFMISCREFKVSIEDERDRIDAQGAVETELTDR